MRDSHPRDQALSPLLLKASFDGDPSEIKEPDFLYGDWLIRGVVTALAGDGGVGKSALIMTMANAMAAGVDLLGDAVPKPLRVGYFNFEDPREVLDQRQVGVQQQHDLEAPKTLYYSGSETEAFQIIVPNVRKGSEINLAAQELLKNHVTRLHLDVLIIDPALETNDADEKTNANTRQFVRAYREIATAGDCAVLLVTHTRKLDGRDPTADDMLGSVGLKNGLRSLRMLARISDEDANALSVPEALRRHVVRLSTTKANLSELGPPRLFYKFGAPICEGGSDVVRVISYDPADETIAREIEAERERAADRRRQAESEQLARIGVTDGHPVHRFAAKIAAMARSVDQAPCGVARVDQQADAWAGRLLANELDIDIGPRARKDRSDAQEDNRKAIKSALEIWSRRGDVIQEISVVNTQRRPVKVYRPGRAAGNAP